LNSFFILVAVVLILGYLIARPHIGTFYQEQWIDKDTGRVDTGIGGEFHRFLSSAECKQDAEQVNLAMVAGSTGAGSTGTLPKSIYVCASRTELMWGW